MAKEKEENTNDKTNEGISTDPTLNEGIDSHIKIDCTNYKTYAGCQKSEIKKKKIFFTKYYFRYYNAPWKRSEFINGVLALFTILIFIYYTRLFKQSENQFALINGPNLVLGNIKEFPTLDSSVHWLALAYFIWNIGNHPIHLYYIKRVFIFKPLTKEQGFDTLRGIQYSRISTFLTKEYSFFQTVSITHNLDSTKIDKLKRGECTLCAEYVYFNEITHKWNDFILINNIRSGAYNETGGVIWNENAKDTTIKGLPLPYPYD